MRGDWNDPVVATQANASAFIAIKCTGEVVTWGCPASGGEIRLPCVASLRYKHQSMPSPHFMKGAASTRGASNSMEGNCLPSVKDCLEPRRYKPRAVHLQPCLMIKRSALGGVQEAEVMQQQYNKSYGECSGFRLSSG